MNQNRTVLKSTARDAMKQAVPSFVLVTLVFILLTSILPSLINTLLNTNVSLITAAQFAAAGNYSAASTYLLRSGIMGLFLTLVLTLFTAIINFGYTLWSLRCWRKEECTMGTLVEGFGSSPHIIWVIFLTMLMQFAHLFLLISLLMLATLITTLISPILSLTLMAIGTTIFGIRIILRFLFVPHVMADNPNMGAFATIAVARALTHKRLSQIFRLLLSFFWWLLLSYIIDYIALTIFIIITAGASAFTNITDFDGAFNMIQMYALSTTGLWISMLASIPLALWLFPYMEVTLSGFYDNLVSPNAMISTPSSEDVSEKT